MENEKTIKSEGEQISQLSNDTEPTISRRRFSLGASGILLAGTVMGSQEHDALSTLVAKTSTLSAQPKPQKLAPHAFNQPQHILSDTTASVWSPDSRHIATFSENVVTLYNVTTSTSELTYHKHTDEILTVKWSADGKYLASSSFDYTVHVWDAVLGQTMTMYKEHTAIVRDIIWSPQQYYLASAGYDKTVQVWEALTGRKVVTYTGHAAEIHTLTWSPDSRYVTSTDLQNRTMIWRVLL